MGKLISPDAGGRTSHGELQQAGIELGPAEQDRGMSGGCLWNGFKGATVTAVDGKG